MGTRVLLFLAPLRQFNILVRRRAIAFYCAIVAASFVIAFTPVQPTKPFTWFSPSGITSERLLPIFSATSWGSYEPQVIELHASDNPLVSESQWGVAHISADVHELREPVERRIVFRITQPDWSLQPEASDTAANNDGVLLKFSADRNGKLEVVQQTVLSVAQNPEQRRWNVIAINIPDGATRLWIDVDPQRFVNYDRVWLTPGEQDQAIARFALIGKWFGLASIFYIIAFVALVGIARLKPLPIAEWWFWVVTHVRSSVNIIERYGSVLIGCCCIYLGYLLIWQRGFYMDDYTNYSDAVNPVTGEWKLGSYLVQLASGSPARALAYAVNAIFSGLIPEHEFIVRFIAAFGLGIDALLLGYLVYRMVGSRAAAVVAGWAFLMPFFAQEAVLWAGTAAFLAVGLSLAMLHALWNGIERQKSPNLWIICGLIAFLLALLMGEVYILVLGLLPLLALITVLRGQGGGSRRVIMRLSIALLLPMLVGGIFYKLFYAGSKLVASRGGLDTNLERMLGRIPDYMYVAWWLIADAGWGGQLTSDSFALGFKTLNATSLGLIVCFVALGLLVLLAVKWRASEHNSRHFYIIGLTTIVYGLAWGLLTLLFPNILVTGQILANRQLFMPFVGVCVMIGAIASIIMRLLRHPGWEKLLVLLGGAYLIASTLCMIGYAQSFATRSQLDKKQIQALTSVLPPQVLPPGAILIPYNTEERLFGKDDVLSLLMVGVFETPWSASSALDHAYHRDDLSVVTANRWAPMKFRYVPSVGSEPGQLYIQGQLIPLEQAILFTYRNGSITFARTLKFTYSDSTDSVVEFPLATVIASAGGPVDDISVFSQK